MGGVYPGARYPSDLEEEWTGHLMYLWAALSVSDEGDSPSGAGVGGKEERCTTFTSAV